MSQSVSESTLKQALSQVRHPEFEDHNLVELGMLQQIELDGDQVRIRLALPLPNIPIEHKLIDLVREAITQVDSHLQVQVTPVTMEPEQRAAFMCYARGGEPPASLRQIGHVVAVMSGKGGVGKSSVAGLLASALRREGLRVGVLDADITGPSIPKMFGVHHPPRSSPDGILPVESRTGIKLMSINLLLTDESQAVIWRGPLISRAIEQFWRDSVWGELDYLIVDLPPGTSDAALTVAQQLPVRGILLVTSPQDLAGMVVCKAADMAIHVGIPLIGLVENMSYVVCPACGVQINAFGPSQAAETARRIGTRLLGHIPLDSELAVLCDAGLVEDYRCDVFAELVKEVREFAPIRAPG
jgi:Mrp family chromosome partitioning ATPase